MTTVAESITKIRRLIKDPDSKVLTTDNLLLSHVGRMQQDFAMKTLCLAKVEEMEAPSNITWCIAHNWEEGFVDSHEVFTPFFRDGTYSSSQAFELAGSYNLSGDGYTITCGDDVMSVDPQHDIPLFPGVDYFKPIAMFWNYKALSQKSYSLVDEYYNDGWHFKGEEVDFFSHDQATRKKAIVTRGIPYTKPDDITTTRAQSLIDNTLRSSMFILVFNSVPERPDSTLDDMEVQEPFIKFIEYGVAARVLSSYNQLRNKEKAAHFLFRYNLGINLTKRVMSMQIIERSLRLGNSGRSKGMKPRYPRLPQHYPALRVR